MRKTYRSQGVREYWASRWSEIPVDPPMENKEIYPLKYALQTVQNKEGEILEAGCGAGRVLRYFHDNGYNILGMDFVAGAVQKLSETDNSLKVVVGDITALDFADDRFEYVLAYGLYHNLEAGLEKAVAETFRVMKSGGAVCASFRADNLQTRISDWLADRKKNKGRKSQNIEKKQFHKLNLTRKEFEDVFRLAGFVIEFVDSVENMPLLYKFRFFRSGTHKVFDENIARSEGYQLSFLGNILQKLMMRLWPEQFCNVYVIIGRKP